MKNNKKYLYVALKNTRNDTNGIHLVTNADIRAIIYLIALKKYYGVKDN